MSAEAISESTFIREFTRELHNRNGAIFAGAGFSMASGYVDWKGLLKNLITDLGLDPEQEDDLVESAPPRSHLSHVHAEWPATTVEEDNLVSPQSELCIGLAVVVGEFHLVNILIKYFNDSPHLASSELALGNIFDQRHCIHQFEFMNSHDLFTWILA